MSCHIVLGHSVCCHVHGFEPYFYINCPPGMGHDDIPRFRQVLEVPWFLFLFFFCFFLLACSDVFVLVIDSLLCFFACVIGQNGGGEPEQ